MTEHSTGTKHDFNQSRTPWLVFLRDDRHPRPSHQQVELYDQGEDSTLNIGSATPRTMRFMNALDNIVRTQFDFGEDATNVLA